MRLVIFTSVAHSPDTRNFRNTASKEQPVRSGEICAGRNISVKIDNDTVDTVREWESDVDLSGSMYAIV